MNQTVKLMFRVTAVMGVFVFIAVNRVSAQTGQNPRNNPDPARHAEENERDLEQRIWNLRLLSEQARKPSPKRPTPQQALEQMQKDFVRLQILNKSLLRAALGDAPLDPRFVSKSMAEIRERAERLNTNLALPEAERIIGPTSTDLGGVFQFIWAKVSPQTEKEYRIPLASGLIAGEAIIAVVLAILAASGVKF